MDNGRLETFLHSFIRAFFLFCCLFIYLFFFSDLFLFLPILFEDERIIMYDRVLKAAFGTTFHVSLTVVLSGNETESVLLLALKFTNLLAVPFS